MNQDLKLAQSIASEYLANFAKSDNFWQDFELAFGHEYNQKISLDIKSNLANKIFLLPEIVLVDSQVLGNANAAFAAQINTIYIL